MRERVAPSAGSPSSAPREREPGGAAPTAADERAAEALAELGHRFDGVSVLSTAARGVSGAGQPLPWRDPIQRAFGRHRVDSVRAHSDAGARHAATALGAGAFAAGEHVAFAAAPSLRTAAHEAAHVVQQRQGAEPAGGLGEPGDVFERRADAVAERVVAGRSAEALLGPAAPPLPPPSSSPPAAQRDLKAAIVFAVHAEINLPMPYSIGGVVATLKAMPDRSALKYTGLLAALKDKLSSAECDEIDKALAAGPSGSMDDGSDTKHAAPKKKKASPSAASATEEFAPEVDDRREAELVELVKGLLGGAVTQVGKALTALQTRAQQSDRPLFDSLKTVFGYLQTELGTLGDGGRIVWFPEDGNLNELATTSLTNHGITLHQAFFKISPGEQVDTLIHETAHAVLGAADVAYYWQRIYQLMPGAAHARNADSYALQSRALSGGPNKLPGRRFGVKDGVDGVPATTERDIAMAEHLCLYGKEAFPRCVGFLGAKPPSSGQPLPPTPEVASFLGKLADPLGAGRGDAIVFAKAFGTACGLVSELLKKPVNVVAAGADPGTPTWKAEGVGFELIVRTNSDNLAKWILGTALRDLAGLESKRANFAAGALTAMFTDSGQQNPLA